MTHFANFSKPLSLEADFVVVGSGAGGAVAAAELARAGARVVVVEAGPWLRPEDLPHSMTGTFARSLDHWGLTLTRGRAWWPVVQGRAVGGGTVVNSAILVRTPEDIFEHWAREHGVEGLAEPVLAAERALEEELGATPTPPAVAGRHNALAAAGAAALGYASHPTLRATPQCAGAGVCLQGCHLGRKRSADLVFLPEVLERGALLSSAPARRVRISGGAAVGVDGVFSASGQPYSVTARRGVLLAASVTYTAPLLQRSGYRHPALGEHFRAHPGTTSFGEYPEEVDMLSGATQGWASTHFREEPGYKLETLSMPPELVAGRLSGGGTRLMERLRHYRALANFVVGLRAESEGRVRAGWGGASALHYTLDGEDMQRLRHAAWTLARTHFAAGARAVYPGIQGFKSRIEPGEEDLIMGAPLDPRAWVAILSHLFGGAVMGGDPQRAVCDTRGRVRGVQRLGVVDASVIPTNLGVNPQLTIMGIARVFARGWAEGAP